MTRTTKRIIVTACVPAFVAVLAWVAGYDFDSRGFFQAYLLLVTALVTVYAWLFSGDLL